MVQMQYDDAIEFLSSFITKIRWPDGILRHSLKFKVTNSMIRDLEHLYTAGKPANVTVVRNEQHKY